MLEIAWNAQISIASFLSIRVPLNLNPQLPTLRFPWRGPPRLGGARGRGYRHALDIISERAEHFSKSGLDRVDFNLSTLSEMAARRQWMRKYPKL